MDMRYKLSKVSAQTDDTSMRPPPPPSFLLMKWVPDVILSPEDCKEERTLPLMACGQPSSTLLLGGRDAQKYSIFYFLRLPNIQSKLDPVLEEVEVHSDNTF